jgi:HD-GYP domain-containing protein (c-di-GMP phosphodiesterase class II)
MIVEKPERKTKLISRPEGRPPRTCSPDLLLTQASFQVEAASQRPWEEAVAGPVREGPSLKGNGLLGLLRVSQYLSHLQSLDDLLQLILDDTVAVLDAQRGCIILADKVTGGLELQTVSFSSKPASSKYTFSRTLASHCFKQGKSILCRDVSQNEALCSTTSIAYGAMTSIICAIVRTPRHQLGLLHLDRGPLQDPFTQADFDLADTIAAQISIGIENAQMAEMQRDLFLHTVASLAQAVDMRDSYTGNHVQRVTQYAMMLGHELRLEPSQINQLRIATPLHDIGKIAVDDAVLRKPGKLTSEEFEMMKTHVLKGTAILQPIPGMSPMLPIIRNHHERWDGAGYPDGLAGGQIPPLARIVAVADAFDAMTSDRPYRRALPLTKAFQEVLNQSGSQFDPACVEAWQRLQQRVETAWSQNARIPQSLQLLSEPSLRAEVKRYLGSSPAAVRSALAGIGRSGSR